MFSSLPLCLNSRFFFLVGPHNIYMFVTNFCHLVFFFQGFTHSTANSRIPFLFKECKPWSTLNVPEDGYMHMSTGVWEARGMRSLGTGPSGSCELSNVGEPSGEQQVLLTTKSSLHPRIPFLWKTACFPIIVFCFSIPRWTLGLLSAFNCSE